MPPPRFLTRPTGSLMDGVPLLPDEGHIKSSLFSIDNGEISDVEPVEQPSTSKATVDSVQREVDSVVDVMKSNIQKVAGRGEALDELYDKSESLASSADYFVRRSGQLRQGMWWRRWRARLVVAGLILLLLLVIIVPLSIKGLK